MYHILFHNYFSIHFCILLINTLEYIFLHTFNLVRNSNKLYIHLILFLENVVGALKTKKKIPYYHRRFKRVPTIDECVLRDMPCVFEANEQYKRDKYVKLIILDTWGGGVTSHMKVYTDSVMGQLLYDWFINFPL